MQKIMITGVAGFLGSRFAKYLIENKKCKIIGIDDLSGGYIENVPEKCVFYQKNIEEREQIIKIIRYHRPDIIYHFSAYATEGLSPFIRQYNYTNNLIASTNLITGAIEYGVKRFVFASSMAVYGDKHKPPFDESLQQTPIDPYGVAKFAVEQDLKIAGEQHGLNYTIIRPHNFYGESQSIWDKYRNVLGIWMYKIINNQPMMIYGDGEQKRAFSYVGDSLEPFWQASQNDECIGEIINLGGTKEISINEASKLLIDITGYPIAPVYLEKRFEASKAWTTWEKSERLLGYKHVTGFREGLTNMWEWVKQQPKRPRKSWNKFELNKGLYEYWK